MQQTDPNLGCIGRAQQWRRVSCLAVDWNKRMVFMVLYMASLEPNPLAVFDFKCLRIGSCEEQMLKMKKASADYKCLEDGFVSISRTLLEGLDGFCKPYQSFLGGLKEALLRFEEKAKAKVRHANQTIPVWFPQKLESPVSVPVWISVTDRSQARVRRNVSASHCAR